MANIKTPAIRFINDESGQNLIEYALIATLIGLAAITALTPLGTEIKTAFNNIRTQLSNNQ